MDRAAFDQWVDGNYEDIVRVAASVLRPRQPYTRTDNGWKPTETDTSVNELVQRALARIYSTESYLRCQVSPLTWVTNAVKDAARDNRRSRGREAAMKVDLPHLVDGKGIPGIGGRHRSPAK